MQSHEADSEGVIECRVTPWFYRRMGMLATMFLVFAILFFKDGFHTWPKENEMAAKKVWFDKEVLEAFDKARTAGQLPQWKATAKAQGLPLNAQDEPVKWASYAAERGWPEKPRRHTLEEVRQQYYWGGAMTLALLIVGVNVLINRNKKLVGHADHLVTPGGLRVNFADVFRVDKRPWAVKGLAYVWYREEGKGSERKAAIDDLKFDGAGKVLDRLLACFKGELIDKAPDPHAPETPVEGDSKA